MVWENTDIYSGSDGGYGGDLSTTTGVNNANNASWTDRIFSTGTDFVSQYLDYQAQTRLAKEQTKYQLAASQQAAVLGTPEVPQNVQVAPVAMAYQPQNTIAGIDKNVLLLGVLAVVAYVAIK